MSDAPAAAPAVPAAAPSSAPKAPNGATGPAAPAPTPKAAPAPGSAPRANDGRFLPKVGDQAEPAPAPPAAEPEEEELYELKVGDRRVKLTKQQLLARAQKAEAVDERFQQAAQAIKKAEDLIASFEADPEAVLLKLGKDPAALLDAHLARKAKEATMTPEQREHEALKRELAAYKAKEQKAEAERKTVAQQAQDEKTHASLEKTLLTAAQTYGLDRNPQTLEQLCDVALEAIDMGYELTPDQACEEVIHRQKEHLASRDAKILSKLPDDKLAEYLGQGVVDRLLKASLKQMPAPGATSKPREPKEPRPEKGYLSEADFEKSLGLRK